MRWKKKYDKPIHFYCESGISVDVPLFPSTTCLPRAAGLLVRVAVEGAQLGPLLVNEAVVERLR